MNSLKRAIYLIKILSGTFKGYKWRFLLIVILGFLSGLSGGIGIGAIIPLFSVLTRETGQELDFISKTILDFFGIFGIPFTLTFIVAFIVILFALKAGIKFVAQQINARTATKYELDMRSYLLKKTLDSNWPYLMERKTGYLEKVLMNDVFNVSQIITQISTLILLATNLATYALISFNISMPITLITGAAGIVLFVILKPLFGKTRRISGEVRDIQKEVAHHINENIDGVKIVKATGQEIPVYRKGVELFEKMRNKRLIMALYNHSIGAMFEPLSFVFISLLLVYYYQSPLFEIASFAAIIYLVQKMFLFFQSIQGSIYQLNQNVPYIKSVVDYKESVDKNQEEDLGTHKFKFERDFKFEGVNFAYEEGGNILSDISFRINRGEMVGIVGASGGGKTTLVNIILRLLEPLSGEIYLDGRNANDISLKSWRKNIGYVSQDVFLINDTIKNNIKFYDRSITENDIVRATKMANIYNFIQKLPKKFDTEIGEKGVKLSGGQRQRVALARTLARNPQILILDEATSSLDNKSEILIQKAIENLKGKIMVLAIAHRLSTIMNSDKLIVLEEGKILEQSTPKKLLGNKDSHFYKMYNIRK